MHVNNKLLLSILFSLSVIFTSAQSSEKAEELVRKNFTEKKISAMPAEGVGSLDYWKFFAQNGYKVIDLSKTKPVAYKTVSMDESTMNSL